MANLEQCDVSGVKVLTLTGSLGQADLAEVQKSFYDATSEAEAAVVLDLTNVDYLSTPAIAMFLDVAKTVKATGGRIVATGAQPRVGDVLKRLRLDEVLPVTQSVDEGVRRVQR